MDVEARRPGTDVEISWGAVDVGIKLGVLVEGGSLLEIKVVVKVQGLAPASSQSGFRILGRVLVQARPLGVIQD